MRWSSGQGRDTRQFAAQEQDRDWDVPDDAYDLDVELERHEMANLLDRAMAMLPRESREVLVERYIHESPHAEIAARLGLTGSAVAKRLERGRLRLKGVLSTALIHEAASHSLAEKLYDDWEETNIWCMVCGQRRLLARFTPGGMLWLFCKSCCGLPVSLYCSGGSSDLFRGVRGYRTAQLRLLEDHWRRFQHGVAGRMVRCPACSRPVRYRIGLDPFDHAHVAALTCDRCGLKLGQFKTDWSLLATPEGRRFWREHPRIGRLPEYEIEARGVAAIIAGYESLTGSARIHGVFARDTFECIDTHVMPGG